MAEADKPLGQTERRQDFERDVSQRLATVEGQFPPIVAQLKDVSDTLKEFLTEQRARSRTQWAPLLTALTLLALVMSYFGNLTVEPIKENQLEIRADLQRLEDRTYEESLKREREAGRVEALLETLDDRLNKLED